MNALKNIAKNIQSLDEKKILFTVYKSKRVSNFIIDLNRIGQLFNQGIDTKGKVIGRYSIVTETVYNQNKKAGTPYTLKDTGEFYATFKIKVNSNADFVISANTIKGEDDLLNYSNDLLGLTKPSLNELIKEILPFVIRETRKTIFK